MTKPLRRRPGGLYAGIRSATSACGRANRSSLHRSEVCQLRLELLQRLHLELADALARKPKLAPDRLERLPLALKAEGAGLKAEIQDLWNKGVITSELKQWADEVRIAGDEAAHPEELGEINDAEAKEGLEFMDEFLRHSVAKPERRRRREAARKSEASSG